MPVSRKSDQPTVRGSSMNQTLGRAFAPKDFRRPARIAMATIPASIGFMIARGVAGPASPLPRFEAAPPWPPWFVQVHPAPLAAPIMSWIAVVLGGIGFVAALLDDPAGGAACHLKPE